MVLHGFYTVFTFWSDKTTPHFFCQSVVVDTNAKPLNCCSERFESFLMTVVFGYEFNFLKSLLRV